jgi:serine/threonine protein kinase
LFKEVKLSFFQNNVLVDNAGNPQACDFGLVRFEETMQRTHLTTTSEHVGTALYLAHELVVNQPPIPTKHSDVHALGCIGLEVRLAYLDWDISDTL